MIATVGITVSVWLLVNAGFVFALHRARFDSAAEQESLPLEPNGE
jgi:hypothetical protein